MNRSTDHEVIVEKQHGFPEASFHVSVVSQADNSKSSHTVTLSRHFYDELTNGAVSPETLLIQSFYFLLEREPKEAILPIFDLPEIGKYFSEYAVTIKKDIEHM